MALSAFHNTLWRKFYLDHEIRYIMYNVLYILVFFLDDIILWDTINYSKFSILKVRSNSNINNKIMVNI